MIDCTCSGHANEPNPCPACLSEGNRQAAVDAEFEAGDLDMDLGAEVRRQRRSLRSVRAVVDEFLESRLEAAIPCPREEA